MKPYSELSNEEKLTISESDMVDCVKREAMKRGVEIPIKIADLMNDSGFRGFSFPPDSKVLYEVVAPGEHGSETRTGVAFTTMSAAEAAVSGAVAVRTLYSYDPSNRRDAVVDGEFRIQTVHLSLVRKKCFSAVIEEHEQCLEEFEKIAEECAEDLSALRQDDYNRKVTARRWDEYLRLADGNKAVAAKFWAERGYGQPPETETAESADNS